MFRICAPPPDLADGIEMLWAVALHATVDGTAERIVPDGCCELVVHVGDRFDAAALEGPRTTQPLALLHGQLARALQLWPRTHAGMIAARFRPHGVSTLLGMPPAVLGGTAVDLAAVYGAAADALLDAVRTARDVESQWRALVDFLRLQRRRVRERAWLPHAVARLADGGRIDDVAAASGISTRTLARTLERHVGLEPKQFQLLRRIARAARRVQAGEPLTAIAHDAGFADHSHFGRTFRTIVGCTPLQYRIERAAGSALVAEGR